MMITRDGRLPVGSVKKPSMFNPWFWGMVIMVIPSDQKTWGNAITFEFQVDGI